MPPATRCCLMIWLTVWPLIFCPTARAAEQGDREAKEEQTPAVFRISKAFLAEVAGRPIVASIPLRATVLNFQCTGMIHAEGKLAIELLRSGQQAVFAVDSQGSAHACVRGIRGPIVAHGVAWGPFTSRTIVHFDGRRFAHHKTTPNATVRGDVRRVAGRRDRPMGRLIGAGILPVTDKLMSKAVAQATPIANGYLLDFVEETADKIIIALNQTTPIEASVHRLFPETDDWGFQVSSDEKFLQAAYGPPDAAVAQLPELAAEFASVRLEAWLPSTGEEARLLAEMSRRPLARQLVQRYLESTLPELAALAEERSVNAVGSWVVIRIGGPKPQ